MKKIAILSDTHSGMLPPSLVRELAKVDFIIHAGDIADPQALKAIQAINRVEAVCGNMDDETLRRQLPRRLILECEKIRIGVIHGDGSPQHLVEGVQEEFADDRVDIVIFGHSHEAFHEKIGKVVFFNPGAPNDDMFAPYCSYGLLEVNGKNFKLKIVKVK